MVHEKPARLKIALDDHGPDEAESGLLESLAHSPGDGRFGGCRVIWADMPDHRTATDQGPKKGAERRARLFPKIEKSPSIAHGRLDLGAVADDPWIRQEALDPCGSKGRNLFRHEVAEGPSVGRAPGKDAPPVETRLRALKGQEFEEVTIFPKGNAPLAVMVRDVKGIARRDPGTA